MISVERVTVTLPDDLIKGIDRQEKNRSKFVAEAVRHELDRRRRADLLRSLRNPHSECATPGEQNLSDQGLEEWSLGLPEEDAQALLDNSAGRAIRWVSGQGWVEEKG